MTVAELNAWGKGSLPGLIGFEVVSVDPGRLLARMQIRPDLLAPNGYLHAAAVIGLGTALDGSLSCEAVRPHRGRTTQVWDATVKSEQNGKTLALFRCTQMILYAS